MEAEEAVPDRFQRRLFDFGLRTSSRSLSRSASMPRKGVITRMPTYGISARTSIRAGSTISISGTLDLPWAGVV